MDDKGANKRAAKNAIALTIRMIIATIVGLYTSRLVIEALGLSDYGIYGVVGGVVGMASFLNSSMAGATSRFITYAIGRGDKFEARQVFSSAFIIHCIIALFVAIIAETIGLWFINFKMNFPSDSMLSVNILYQFTIISMVLGFTQVPYSAEIVAHEKMSIYAYFELINIFLKLVIVFVLFLFDSNRLVLYASLMLFTSIITLLFYRWYCVKSFDEARLTRDTNRNITRSMLRFSGYDLYGNMGDIARNQGQPIILNMFFGVIANASASLSLTINGTLSGLSTNVAIAFKPQIVKAYASGKIAEMSQIMRRSAIFTLCVFGTLSIPFFIDVEDIVYLWIGKTPEYIVPILRLTMIASIFSSLIRLNNSAIHATGNIRGISFCVGSLYIFCPVLSYGILKGGLISVNVIYGVNALILIVVAIIGWFYLKKLISEMNISEYIKSTIKILILLSASIFLTYGFKTLVINNYISLNDNWSGKLLSVGLTTLIGILLFLPSCYFSVLNYNERSFVKLKLQNIIKNTFN